ncbi:MAG: Na/Pi cotransporter family protein, partial [Lachnospiraceae bacterium]|nr:Na/Pi cotransporter family protein [Lachnospiraceae bacterium]
NDTGVAFSKDAQADLGLMLDMVNTLLRFSVEMFVKSSEEHAEDVTHLGEAIDEKEKELQQKHLERLTNNECTPEAGVLFSDIISGLERVAEHATNIAFATVAADV